MYQRGGLGSGSVSWIGGLAHDSAERVPLDVGATRRTRCENHNGDGSLHLRKASCLSRCFDDAGRAMGSFI